MTEPKQPKKPEPKRPNRTGVSFGGYMDPDVAQALDEYIAEAEPRTTKMALIEMLLKKFFREQGLWPPKPTG